MIGLNQPVVVSQRIHLFQGWLASINWMLGKNSLTEEELKIVSYLLYYNDKYKSITDEEARNELLFSTSVKKKIKNEFGVESQKLETYLNKLRKKDVITSSNTINPRFIIYPEDTVVVKFDFKLNSVVVKQEFSSPHVDTIGSVPLTEEVSHEETTEIAATESVNLWDKYMTSDTITNNKSTWNTEDE